MEFSEQLEPVDLLHLHSAHVFVNPLVAEAEDRNVAWARKYGIADDPRMWAKMSRTRPAVFAANTYRSAPLPLLALGADIITWLFIFDDTHGEGSDALAAASTFDLFETAFNGKRTSAASVVDEALIEALLDMRGRMRAMSNIAWIDRFSANLRHYFNGCLLELPYRTRGVAPSLANYRQIRLGSIGGFPAFDLIELEYCPSDTARLVTDARWHELRHLTTLLCAWTNDIYSFNKEAADRDPINLIQVLRQERKLFINDAQDAAAALYLKDLKRFQTLRRAFDDSPEVTDIERACTQALENWIYGNVAWSKETARYRQKNMATPVSAWTQAR